MNFNDYQKQAMKTALLSNDTDASIIYRALGLSGESGEVAGIIKKIIRDHNSDFSKIDKENLIKELGDVLWYIATISDFFNISLEEIAQTNITKLKDRQRRNVLGGSGDNR